LQYNVPGGKKNRGLALIFAYRMLAGKDELTPENIRLSQIMGWCVEMVTKICVYLSATKNALTCLEVINC
jgi:farnesyl diphosphate synthase